MTRPFSEFLESRIAMGGFTTEDAIALFLPLARQVLAIHQQGNVALLQGASRIELTKGGLGLTADAVALPKSNLAEVERLSRLWRSNVEIVDQAHYEHDVETGERSYQSRSVATSEELTAPLQRAVYLPGYEAWEQRVEHHDPLSDLFVLGLVLASVAQSLPLFDLDNVRLWQSHRRHPFAQWPALHPLLAQTIYRLTELDRQKRTGDLAAVIASLENYREQPVDLEFDLGAIPGFRLEEVSSRRQIILTRLKERLFDLSRRNRLLHDPSNSFQSLNLTQASVPLSFDPQTIAADRIWTWNPTLKREITKSNRISLGKHLNMAEAVYLPTMLDRIRLEARRDLNEFGFEQLRLVACYITWCDLKSPSKDWYRSPLVLIPVRLHKRKGVRDQFELEPLSHEAEINPVIRHRFQQLFGIKLPEALDLNQTDLDALHSVLQSEIRRSEPAVLLEKIDRPRVARLHARAKRQLEQFRRRAQRQGRGRRAFADVAYSYDPVTYNPAGLRLFQEFIRPSETTLDVIMNPRRKRESFMVPAASESTQEAAVDLLQMQSAEQSNPFVWSFDLCSLTLANLRYRRMTLVRDYDALLEQSTSHQVFDAAFSGEMPDLLAPAPEVPPIADRFDIVSCDPTQATAISRARSGESYIIQGPPGTGKSQTIANLIADFVGRGKRVLFVCEKRAAIDVVHARLRQCGIGHLACLIHDSQSDKRAFIEDLRLTQERLVEAAQSAVGASQNEAERLTQELEMLTLFDSIMRQAESSELLACRERIAAHFDLEARLQQAQLTLPQLSAAQQEALPDLKRWHESRDAMKRLYQWLHQVAPGRYISEHPLRFLDPQVTEQIRPIERITQGLKQTLPLFERWRQAWREAEVELTPEITWAELRAFASHLQPLQEFQSASALALIDPQSAAATRWNQNTAALKPLRSDLQAKSQLNEHWTDKLAPGDTDIALDQARRLENQWWRWVSPTWWRLRSTLQRSYRFGSHQVPPSYSLVLERLSAEHAAADRVRREEQALLESVRWSGSLEQLEHAVQQGREVWQTASPSASAWLAGTLALSNSPQRVSLVLRTIELAQQIESETSGWLDAIDQRTYEELWRVLPELEHELERLPEFLEPLKQLRSVASVVRETLRRLPMGIEPIELAILSRSIDRTLRSDPRISRFDSLLRDQCQARLEVGYQKWLRENSIRIEHQVAVEVHDRIQAIAAMGRARNQAPELQNWAEGLKELQHEFKKSMRHRAIRDLVSDKTGEVIKALKPIWLMSPLSVSDALPLDPDLFDVVIFDEASQITLEDAVPTIFRARQSIVVGDEKQMPPTRFFASSGSSMEEDEGESDEPSESLGLEETSFLAHAARVLPATLLGWHYRSRSESLISYSNWMFYDGRLLTAPEEAPPAAGLPAIRIERVEQGSEMASAALARPISYHRVPGVYERRRNRVEADYIAHLVRQLLRDESGRTLGVVAFSEAQQDEIDSALDRLAAEDQDFRDRIEAEREREDDGQFCGLLVKNLENIQGDERDLMILSVCYGPDPNGRMLMNFGPINQSGGEKRLNVAFSRAKHHMVIVASIEGEAITNTYNPGALAFRNYLLYASAMSQGRLEAAQQILRSQASHASPAIATDPWNAALTDELERWLQTQGFEVDRNVGQSRFVVDLAVRVPGESAYRLGILLDGQAYYERPDLLEREMMRPKLLVDFGWRIVVMLGKDWYQNRSQAQTRILTALQTAEDE